MCNVELSPDEVRIIPSRWEHTGGLQGKFEVPIAGIAEISTSYDPVKLVRGIRVGVGLPKTRIGKWYHGSGRDYLCIRHNGPAVVLDLVPGQKFLRVVVTVADPEGLAAQIQDAVAAL